MLPEEVVKFFKNAGFEAIYHLGSKLVRIGYAQDSYDDRGVMYDTFPVRHYIVLVSIEQKENTWCAYTPVGQVNAVLKAAINLEELIPVVYGYLSLGKNDTFPLFEITKLILRLQWQGIIAEFGNQDELIRVYTSKIIDPIERVNQFDLMFNTDSLMDNRYTFTVSSKGGKWIVLAKNLMEQSQKEYSVEKSDMPFDEIFDYITHYPNIS